MNSRSLFSTLIAILFIFFFGSCKSDHKENLMKDDAILHLITQMTLEEKISMVHGDKGTDPNGLDYVGYLPGIDRLGIPPIKMQNGPSGAGATFGNYRHKAPATAFPVPAAQASTWNKELLYKLGNAVGLETKAQGRDVLLGPSVNIVRIPEGGRIFEYFSEDPYLSARCGVSVVKGIQDVGIMACAKHFAANSQETWRHTIDEKISERALREIYLPAFEACVIEGKVASLMASYNKINEYLCTENPILLRQIVKTEWDFPGFIMTDWGTRHKTSPAVNAGLDLEMSGWGKFGEAQFKHHLLTAVQTGDVSESIVNEMVYRILSEMKRFGHLKENKDFPAPRMDTPEHRELALQVALEGMVLLKNRDQTLPLNSSEIKSIALFGDALTARASGGGSSNVVPFYKVSPIEGLKNRLKDTEINYYERIKDAEEADVAIVYIYVPSSETEDRTTISLDSETELIEMVSSKYDKTIVFLRTAGASTIPWIDQVDAVFQVWYPGQEEGNAEAALLFGDVNPSGKLPVTFGKDREDFPASTEGEFPGIDEVVNYSEGIFVGYRYFDHFGTDILFPFGHGLSYTNFSYNDLSFSTEKLSGNDTLEVSYTITNIGNRDGAEISQLYISDVEASLERPVKELKGFNKSFLKPGESEICQLYVSKRDLAFWDEDKDCWKAENGAFEIFIGSSSQDIRLNAFFNYKNSLMSGKN